MKAPLSQEELEALANKADRRWRDMLTLVEMLNARLTELERIVRQSSKTEE